MKSFHSLLITFLLIAAVAQAQPQYAPLGSYWNYQYMQHSGFYYSNSTLKVTLDSTAGNTRYKRVTWLEDRYGALPPFQNGLYASQFGYLAYRNDSVFYLQSLSASPQDLYRFNMVVGDTVLIDDFLDIRAEVVLHDTVLVYGQPKQRWTLTKFCNTTFMDSVVVIEDIGPINDLLTWNTEGCIMGGGVWYFQCYWSDSLGYNTPCEAVVVGMEAPTTTMPAWSVTPNPTEGPITAAWDPGAGATSLVLMDLQGRMIQAPGIDGRTAVEMDLAGLPAGVYLLQLQTAGGTGVKRLVKLE